MKKSSTSLVFISITLTIVALTAGLSYNFPRFRNLNLYSGGLDSYKIYNKDRDQVRNHDYDPRRYDLSIPRISR